MIEIVVGITDGSGERLFHFVGHIVNVECQVNSINVICDRGCLVAVTIFCVRRVGSY